MAAVAAVVTATLVEVLLRPPVYEARARMVFDAGVATAQVTGRPADPPSVATEIQVLEGEPVRAAVRQQLGTAPDVTANQVGETSVVVVQTRAPQAELAARGADAYVEAYIEYRRRQAVDWLAAASQEVRRGVDELRAQIADLDRQLSAGPACPASGGGASTSATCDQQTSLQLSLRPRRAELRAEQAFYEQRLNELQVDSALQHGGARLASPAAVPRAGAHSAVANGLVALVAGLLGGLAWAYVHEDLDDRVRSREEVEARVGLDVLGALPGPRRALGKRSRAEPSFDSDPSAAEAYRALGTAVAFLLGDRQLASLAVAGVNGSEGVTTTTAQLAVALARAGRSVVAVDADLRQPRLHQVLGLPNDTGLTAVVLGRTGLAEALQAVPGEPALRLMASGPLVPMPSEVLHSARIDEVLIALATLADVVIIDCPPVLPLSDAAVVAPKADATLLVVRAGVTSFAGIRQAIERLAQVQARPLGVVFREARRGRSGGVGTTESGVVAQRPAWLRGVGPTSAAPGHRRT